MLYSEILEDNFCDVNGPARKQKAEMKKCPDMGDTYPILLKQVTGLVVSQKHLTQLETLGLLTSSL